MHDFGILPLDHFKALAIFASARGAGRSKFNVDPRIVEGFIHLNAVLGNRAKVASAYADTLYQQNIRSIKARRPEISWSKLPGPEDKPLHISVTLTEILDQRFSIPIAQIFKMCDALDFQYWQDPQYSDSLANRLVYWIRRAAAEQLPGYQEAPEHFTRSDQADLLSHTVVPVVKTG